MLFDGVHVWRAELNPAESRQALRQVLAAYLDEEPAAVALRRGERGKPALADPAASLRFNLSHSGGLTLIAVVDSCEVGVDVERIRSRGNLLRLAERALEPPAAAAVRAAPPDERLSAFHAAWVRHEAIAKCHGGGLWTPLPDIGVAVSELKVASGFAAALAVAAPAMLVVKLFEFGAERRGQALVTHPPTFPSSVASRGPAGRATARRL